MPMLAAAGVLIPILAGTAAASHVEQLGTLGGSYSRIARLNNNNQACGSSTIADDAADRAFLYSAGSMQDLGTLGGNSSAAVDMNDAGQVVGWANTPTCHPMPFAGGTVCAPDVHAFLYSNGTMIDIGLGGPVSEATAVNQSGEATGYGWTASGSHAFRYSGGVTTDLGTLGGDSSYGTDINTSGDVVGSSTLAGGEVRAFLYSGGVMTNLGTLDGDSWATAVNDAGDVLGQFRTASFEVHAFLYREGVMTDLGRIETYEEPIFLNEAGQVALARHNGGSEMYDNGVYTSIGNAGDVVQALNSSGETAGRASLVAEPFRVSGGERISLQSAGDPDGYSVDINEHGRVAGEWIVDGLERGVIFTHACRPQPVEGCITAPKSSFQMKRTDDPAKNRLSWSWSSGGALMPEDLGQPGSKTAYELCIYDSLGAGDVLVADLTVMPNSLWRDYDTSRKYKDGSGARDGVQSLQVRSGEEGSTRVRLKAKGANVPLPEMPSLNTFLEQAPRVTVQLIADTTGTCWTSEYADAARNDADAFKASVP